MSDSLWPQHVWLFGLQHARLPCPSPSTRAWSDSCPFNQWCHPSIWSIIPFSSCLQSFPASGSFQMSQLFISGDQSIGASVSASILLMSIQDWFPLGLTGCISCPRDPQESSPTPQFKSINSSAFSLLYGPTVTSIHDYWKNHSLTRWILVGKAMSLLLNMLSRLVITFLQRSKLLLISWLQSPSAMILEPPPKKSLHFHCFSRYLPRNDGTGCYECCVLKPVFSLSFHLHQEVL